MARNLTMADVDAMLLNNHIHVVIDLSPVPVVLLLTKEYWDAKSICMEYENAIMLTITPETAEKVRAGNILELRF